MTLRRDYHHEKWYNEKLKEEMEWEDEVEKEVLASTSEDTNPHQAGEAAPGD